MVEERADELGVEVGDVEIAGVLAGVSLGVAEQQPEGMAIGVHGVMAGITFGTEASKEERLDRRRRRGHRSPSRAARTRSADTASSS